MVGRLLKGTCSRSGPNLDCCRGAKVPGDSIGVGWPEQLSSPSWLSVVLSDPSAGSPLQAPGCGWMLQCSLARMQQQCGMKLGWKWNPKGAASIKNRDTLRFSGMRAVLCRCAVLLLERLLFSLKIDCSASTCVIKHEKIQECNRINYYKTPKIYAGAFPPSFCICFTAYLRGSILSGKRQEAEGVEETCHLNDKAQCFREV